MFIKIVLPGGSGWIIGVDYLGNSFTASWRSVPGDGRPELQLGRHYLFFSARFASLYTHVSLLTFFVQRGWMIYHFSSVSGEGG